MVGEDEASFSVYLCSPGSLDLFSFLDHFFLILNNVPSSGFNHVHVSQNILGQT